jgi:hypothetical protein
MVKAIAVAFRHRATRSLKYVALIASGLVRKEQGNAGAQFSFGLMYANGLVFRRTSFRPTCGSILAAAASQPGARSERDLIAKKMTRQQIDEAVRQARAWEPRSPTPPQ